MEVQTERRFDNADFRRSGVEASKRTPVIDNKAGANYIRTSINGTSLRRTGNKKFGERYREIPREEGVKKEKTDNEGDL
jgi:hypothetical protein